MKDIINLLGCVVSISGSQQLFSTVEIFLKKGKSNLSYNGNPRKTIETFMRLFLGKNTRNTVEDNLTFFFFPAAPVTRD